MKVQIEVDVTDCRNCLFRSSIRGHGECWEECGHKDHNQESYGNILWGCQEQFKKIPIWCPLKLGK